MADTIFYRLKLKRTRTPMEVFEKMKKSVKKRGATKNWVATIDEEKEMMSIDFGDEMSETFVLHFNNKVCDTFCKVYFPLEGELFEDEKKSEFKALLNMIYSARTSFSEMTITDDYGLAEDFMESKKYKLDLRELTEAEMQHVKELYDMGFQKHPDLIMAVIYEGLEIPFGEDFRKYVNMKIDYAEDNLASNEHALWPFFETYLYETAEYKNQGRVPYVPEYGWEFSGIWFSVGAFTLIIDELYRFQNWPGLPFGVKHAQLRRFYKDKIYPLLDADGDDFEKCVLAYRFFLSAFDFCGFKFVGKEKKKQ